jgi:hypothetical protein
MNVFTYKSLWASRVWKEMWQLVDLCETQLGQIVIGYWAFSGKRGVKFWEVGGVL